MDIKPETPQQEMSYALGLDIGTTVREMPIDLDPNCFIQGIIDLLSGNEPKLSQPDFTARMKELRQLLQDKGNERQGQVSDENMKRGRLFMSQNAELEEVTTTASGLQYEILEQKAADADMPTSTSTVTVHYRGRLIDGTEFDSSYSRGEPTSFPLNRVIPGWTEGLQLMTVGSRFRFVIPPELAYGKQGAGQMIGPNSTLIFDVELLDIEN